MNLFVSKEKLVGLIIPSGAVLTVLSMCYVFGNLLPAISYILGIFTVLITITIGGENNGEKE